MKKDNSNAQFVTDSNFGTTTTNSTQWIESEIKRKPTERKKLIKNHNSNVDIRYEALAFMIKHYAEKEKKNQHLQIEQGVTMKIDVSCSQEIQFKNA